MTFISKRSDYLAVYYTVNSNRGKGLKVFLSGFSCLQVIQNKRPWCSAADVVGQFGYVNCRDTYLNDYAIVLGIYYFGLALKWPIPCGMHNYQRTP